jgi:hypothetical protein
MNKIVLYCKSHTPDLARVTSLYESIQDFNIDSIPFYVSVPQEQVSLFKESLPLAIVIADEEIYTGSTPGWIQQQIVKSSFWKLGLSENYVCIDSDSYFIKPFSLNDFIDLDKDTPYTVMHEQKEFFSWSATRISQLGFDPKESFANDRQKIMDIFNRKGKYYDFGPSPTIWSSKVWEALDEYYLVPNKFTFEKLISYSPSEFSWYGESLLAFKPIDLYPVEPLFKVFHYPQQYVDYKQQGVTEKMISQNYLGIVMQSNFNAPLKY